MIVSSVSCWIFFSLIKKEKWLKPLNWLFLQARLSYISVGSGLAHSFFWARPREFCKVLHRKTYNNQMMKVCSNMFVQCALKQAKPLLMGKVAVFILLLCSWHYLLCVSLDYYKTRRLCVIVWEPSLPVADVGADRHSPLRSRRHTSSSSVFPWAGTSCHIYFMWASGKEADSFPAAAVLLYYKIFMCPLCCKYICSVTSQRRAEVSARAWIGRRQEAPTGILWLWLAFRSYTHSIGDWTVWKACMQVIFSPPQ